MDKSYRIHTNISSDTVLDVNMRQDFDFLEVLSLKLRQNDAYRIHSSNYGVIVGRVLANDAFGIPNAKVSVFVERDGNDTVEIENIYPYSEVTTKDRDGRRYNLLPDYSDDECYRIVGTFPNKRLMLDDDIQVEIYDKYWKYTTVTNNAGDYMIFGVPTGNTQVHVDIDLSDIGILSQRPRDFQYKGYNQTLFDSPSQFKESTNLDNLTQIFSQNSSVYVYPFWGDSENGIAAITRNDIQIQYKFEPTCVFMGSIVSDNDGHAIGHRCAPDIENGMNNQLIGGSGTIEMIRKTVDGLVEEYQIQGNQLIDDDGVWCYQIPMNLDYVGTDEYGNIVPTDNPNKGVPTRTQVRFRISKNETGNEGFSRHTAKYLVPMNPSFDENEVLPTIDVDGGEIEKMYNFGSATPDNCFRDLYWNNVYSVKNYIPKVQVARRAVSKNYSALKGSNLADDQNQIPFNKLMIDLPFLYIVVCLVFTMITYIIWFINKFVICTINIILGIFAKIKNIKIGPVRPFKRLLSFIPDPIGCIPLSAGISEGNIAYYPGCNCSDGLKYASCPDDMDGDCKKSSDKDELLDKIQRSLAQEFKIVKLDLYQDWINGALYMPLWYWRKRTKKKFLFFTISKAKNEYCSCDETYSKLKTRVACNIEYTNNDLGINSSDIPENNKKNKKWHKNRDGQIRYRRGLIKQVENKDGLEVYYYASVQATSDNPNEDEAMIRRKKGFFAFRLYATDIILLGNLDKNNIYGIPQFFTCLPPTTANVPPIATIEETNEEHGYDDEEDEFDTSSSEDSGTTLTTGMDWNNDGDKLRPMYKTGLFMDLACTYVLTVPKSCINVERLSELGVSLDMKKQVAYRSNGDIAYGEMDSDGFITKIELDDNDNRAMFATMNHIGFTPQVVQTTKKAYDTQVLDNNTNYLIPKFKYLYPVDFDGRLEQIITKYRNGFPQALGDERSSDYLTFRLGAESDSGVENRKRHFYLNKNNKLSMPLYNNSFYFYFGVNKGKTAIDKFNKMFYAACTSNRKEPFTLDIKARGRSYCPQAYNGNCGAVVYPNGSKKNNAYGYIMVKSDDIRKPYTYELYDSFEDLVVGEGGMTMDEFVIGGQVDGNGNVLSNCEGKVRYQTEEMGKAIVKDSDENDVVLENQVYTLVLIDADGKSITQKVRLETPKVKGKYEVIPLGTKFYDGNTTRIDYICHDDNKFYGEINMTGFSIDSYDCTLRAVQYIGYDGGRDSYQFCITGRSDDISENVVVYFEIRSLNKTDDGRMRNCLCENDGSINLIKARQNDEAEVKMDIPETLLPWPIGPNSPYIYSFLDGVLSLKVYQPNQYLITLVQGCNDCTHLVPENTSDDIVEVLNGTPFTTYLNSMPTLFMLGTKNDNKDADISMKSKFYNNMWTNVASPTHKNLKGWYGVHQEDSYIFPETKEKHKSIWEDSLDKGIGNINEAYAKREILRYKFDKMFELSDGVYVTNGSPLTLRYTSSGGVQPILYRQVVPRYQELEGYVFEDASSVTIEAHQSNIVAKNYKNVSGNGPQFNPYIDSNASTLKLNGNYFAAFTRDGGFVNLKEIDGVNINIERSPSFASVSPMSDSTLKPKGKVFNRSSISDFSLSYNKGRQTLPNDKERDILPYFRGMFVDRRFDYDLVLFALVMGTYFPLNNADEIWKEDVWRGVRLSGTTYNGIEMAYDEEYNIITAKTENEGEHNERAIRIQRLEYSYSLTGNTGTSISGSDSKTYYNLRLNEDCYWNSGNLGYDENTDGKYNEERPDDLNNKQLIKQFYSSEINGVDIRQFYWSDFNRWRLNEFAKDREIYQQSKYYVFKYPFNMTSFYNGEFEREKVIDANSSTYPTRRYLDIGKLPSIPYFNFENVGCSYGMKTTMSQDYRIQCKAKEGETTSIEVSFLNPITMIPMNAENATYENVFYKPIQNSISSDEISFSANNVALKFKFKEFSCSGHNVYTKTPKIIKVLPRFGGNNKVIDGIGYVKMSNPYSEFGGYSDGKTLQGAINDVTILTLPENPRSIWDWSTWGESGYKFPSGVSASEGFFKKEGERLTSDDTDFMNIEAMAILDSGKLKGTKVFSVLVEREFEGEDDDNLTRHIHSVEFSELYDCRDIRIGLINGKDDCYVVLSKTSDSTQGDDGSTNTTNTKLFNQVITLTLKFNVADGIAPENKNCEALMDSSSMSYKFFFKNERGDQYDIVPSEVFVPTGQTGNNVYMRFTIRWGADMGILSDDAWKGGSCKCSFMASSTISNFIYRTDFFTINVDGNAKTREDITEPDVHYQTDISFI